MSSPFDLAGDLPAPGTRVLLEASAGTGKTFAIITLAVRFVAEGRITLPQLLLITFTEDATRDLRARLRDQLTQTATALQDGAPAGDDAILKAIDRTGDRAAALSRIQSALAEYDRAIIRTTHGFCAAMLTELGMLADHDVSEMLAHELDPFVHEIAVDCWLRRFSSQPTPSLEFSVRGLDKRDALKIARLVTNNPGAELWPPRDHPGLNDAARDQVEFAHDVREEFEARKRSLRVQTFDDLQDRLRDALSNPVTGPFVAQRLRERFPLVMVDEFQDTDPVQWQVLHEAFDRHSTMVLIGDPKQAIYGFRGADVQSYLDARRGADATYTLDRNWRTDQPVQEALDALLHESSLGAGIAVTPVSSAHPGRLLGADGRPAAPMQLRLVEGDFDEIGRGRAVVAEHVASHIAATLADPPTLALVGQAPRPVRAADLAVLVRTSMMGELVRDALRARGVPVVFPAAKGVFSSEAAEHWATLLTAVDASRTAHVRALALTPLVGWTLAELAEADETTEADLMRQVRQWARVLADHGVSALFDTVSADRALAERLLGTEGGERLLTDLRHLAQALHRAQRADNLSSAGLLAWLRSRRELDRGSDEEPRRLETDSDVVTIATMHGAKGLEYPLVFLPDTWDRIPLYDVLPRYHEQVAGETRRMLDVSHPFGQVAQAHRQLAEDAQFDEDLRLFYVATTRAEHQVTLWWTNMRQRTRHSPIQRLLFGSLSPGGLPPTDVPQPVEPRPSGLAHLSRAGVDVAMSQLTSTVLAPVSDDAGGRLVARTFGRPIDLRWRRTSYSGLTAEAHELVGVASEPPVTGTDDEPDEAELLTDTPAQPGPVGDGELSPMAELPTGARFGTLVHAIFEEIDFRAPDLAAEVHRHTSRLVARMPLPGVTTGELADALLPSLLTPLGPLAGGLRLADVAVGDRLPELDFDYPLAGGDRPSAQVSLGDVGRLLAEQLPADDPLVDYPAMLADPLLADQSLRGFLTGSIDAVLRFRAAEGPRHVVVDYKTNWLGAGPGTALRVADYHPRALAAAMMRSHYPLQALLYQVALHRFLRWRQPDYDPERHLGGMLYLFVRGMAGPDTPATDGVPHGVFSWRPPTDAVLALSDLIAGGARWAS